MFRDADEISFDLGQLHGTFGKGVVRIELPENPLMEMLFGDMVPSESRRRTCWN